MNPRQSAVSEPAWPNWRFNLRAEWATPEQLEAVRQRLAGEIRSFEECGRFRDAEVGVMTGLVLDALMAHPLTEKEIRCRYQSDEALRAMRAAA
jgi:hypothetical protein